MNDPKCPECGSELMVSPWWDDILCPKNREIGTIMECWRFDLGTCDYRESF